MLYKEYIANGCKYDVYEDGRIYSHSKRRFLLPQLHTNGYKKISISHPIVKSKTEYIHRLVAKVFIENINNLPEVNHKDGDKNNNHKSNLEWVSHKDNMTHAKETGLFQPITDRALVSQKNWIGLKNSSREVIDVTGIKNKNGNYKVIVKCLCTNIMTMYFNDFKKDKQKYCIKCRPPSSYV